jgi:hypothetical protein
MDPDLLAHATEFTFLPEGASIDDRDVFYFTVTVARRSNDMWAVLRMTECWNKETQSWEYEPRDRSAKFLRECRFSLDEAVRIARAMPDTLTLMDKSWLDFKALHALQAGRKEAATHVGA